MADADDAPGPDAAALPELESGFGTTSGSQPAAAVAGPTTGDVVAGTGSSVGSTVGGVSRFTSGGDAGSSYLSQPGLQRRQQQPQVVTYVVLDPHTNTYSLRSANEVQHISPGLPIPRGGRQSVSWTAGVGPPPSDVAGSSSALRQGALPPEGGAAAGGTVLREVEPGDVRRGGELLSGGQRYSGAVHDTFATVSTASHGADAPRSFGDLSLDAGPSAAVASASSSFTPGQDNTPVMTAANPLAADSRHIVNPFALVQAREFVDAAVRRSSSGAGSGGTVDLDKDSTRRERADSNEQSPTPEGSDKTSADRMLKSVGVSSKQTPEIALPSAPASAPAPAAHMLQQASSDAVSEGCPAPAFVINRQGVPAPPPKKRCGFAFCCIGGGTYDE